MRQLFVQANTSTTVFRLNVQDQNDLQRLDYGFHTGMLNDNALTLPCAGRMRISVTNASPNDIFSVYIGVQE